MYQRREGFFEGADKTKLFFQVWENPAARGTILLNHGQAEHSECYQRLINFFENDQWNFVGWDLRGHGRSDGKRGYAKRFDDYVADYRIFINQIMNEPLVQKKPLVLLGHSMGGEIQLKAVIEDSNLQKLPQVYSSPLLGLTIPVPAIKRQGSVWLNKLTPTVTLWNEITYDMLTRDPAVIREFEADVLRHDRISAGVFLGMLENFDFIRDGAPQVQGPVLFQCAEEDPIVSTPAAKEIFGLIASKEKTMRLYGHGARHEIYNDIERAEVMSDLKLFLDPLLK